jgi:hypothetical protein
MATLLVSDTSVLVDLRRGGILQNIFELPFDIGVPDVTVRARAQGLGRPGSRTPRPPGAHPRRRRRRACSELSRQGGQTLTSRRVCAGACEDGRPYSAGRRRELANDGRHGAGRVPRGALGLRRPGAAPCHRFASASGRTDDDCRPSALPAAEGGDSAEDGKVSRNMTLANA